MTCRRAALAALLLCLVLPGALRAQDEVPFVVTPDNVMLAMLQFETDLSVATVITMYLLQEVNLQLRAALLALKPGTRIVSHDWDLGDWRPDRSVSVDAPDKPVGREKRSRLHLWVVPAQAAGSWCGTGALHAARLQLAQKYQWFDATLSLGDSTQLPAGRTDGPRLLGAGGFEVTVDGGRLRVSRAGELPPALASAEFERCAG